MVKYLALNFLVHIVVSLIHLKESFLELNIYFT